MRRGRLKRNDKSGLKERLRKIGRVALGLGAYGGGLLVGYTLLSGRFAPLTKKEISLLRRYSDLVRKKVREGWSFETAGLGGDVHIFRRGDLEIVRSPYNIHVRYIDMDIYDKSYKKRFDSTRDLIRILNDKKLIRKWEEQGRRWILS